MPTTLNSGLQLPDKGSVDWYSSMQTNYGLLDNHLEDTVSHVTAEDKANWNSKQGSLSQAQLDAIAQVATNTNDIATLQSSKADASHTHSSSDITDIDDYATKDYVDNSISGLVDNAPDALNTLNELSAALNDDSNFASTVTTALAAKANSADLATVATSGDYNDLSNKPSIPTKTSDLTNDSDFVDISNSAVSSGITSSKVTDYDTHIADTDIHVTTADKNRWNNQTYVFRYSSTALTPSSTNSNTLLDNTDNLKVGDKVIDSSGVLFSITAIDTQNSTFTIGNALIDLANDSDVVHKSGNETVGGSKTFSDTATFVSVNLEDIRWKSLVNQTVDLNDCYVAKAGAISGYYTTDISSGANISNKATNTAFTMISLTTRRVSASDYQVRQVFYGSGAKYIRTCSNGTWTAWINEADKYVTTDTSQTITGGKTFNGNTNHVGELNQTVLFKMTADTSFVTGSKNTSIYDQNGFQCANDLIIYNNSKNIRRTWTVNNNSSGTTVSAGFNFILSASGQKVFYPITDGDTDSGSSSAYWKSTYTKRVNGVEPSSLSLPSDNLNDVIDISSYLVNLDGTANTYIAPANGWIAITMSNSSGIQAYINGLWGHQIVRPNAGSVRFLMPIVKNLKANILIFNGTIDNARFILCQGNV